MLKRWQACRASGEVFQYESRVRRADGQYLWFLHRNVPLGDDQGNVEMWYGASIEIDDRKRAEEALKKLQESLEYYDAQKNAASQKTNPQNDPNKATAPATNANPPAGGNQEGPPKSSGTGGTSVIGGVVVVSNPVASGTVTIGQSNEVTSGGANGSGAGSGGSGGGTGGGASGTTGKDDTVIVLD